MSALKYVVVVLVATAALVTVGLSQVELGPTTSLTASVMGPDIYSQVCEGTLALKAGEATAEVSVLWDWTIMLYPNGEGRARASLSELGAYVPEFAVGEVRSEGFFVSEANVTDFEGAVDLGTGVCSFNVSVSLRGLVEGLDSIVFEISGNLLTGTLNLRGAGAGPVALDVSGSASVAKVRREAKTWKHYSLSDLLKEEASPATCCGCEKIVITTGGKRIIKIESSSKKLKAGKGDWTTGEQAVVLVRCNCCGAGEKSTVTITWEDKDGKTHKDTVTVECKKPTTYRYDSLKFIPLPKGQGKLAYVDCKAGECLIVALDDNARIKSVKVTSCGTSIRAEKASTCCKKPNAVLIHCNCSGEDCTANVVIKYYDKETKKSKEVTLEVRCKK